jgi:hypothetical protein
LEQAEVQCVHQEKQNLGARGDEITIKLAIQNKLKPKAIHT